MLLHALVGKLATNGCVLSVTMTKTQAQYNNHSQVENKITFNVSTKEVFHYTE